jgi:hypothetical protein
MAIHFGLHSEMNVVIDSVEVVSLHRATTQKTAIFILTTMRTSNHTYITLSDTVKIQGIQMKQQRMKQKLPIFHRSDTSHDRSLH